MIRGLIGLALGAVAALQADKALDRLRERFRSSGMTGALLDKVNRRLEEQSDTPPRP